MDILSNFSLLSLCRLGPLPLFTTHLHIAPFFFHLGTYYIA
jgi:hypothetical protein